jgi:hypothetical protein
MTLSRRSFVLTSAALAAGVSLNDGAFAQVKLDPSDPLAKSLGYVADATKVDKAKFPAYQAGQDCAACQLYQGKPGDASGPCPIYSGKIVSSTGWCGSFVKKA